MQVTIESNLLISSDLKTVSLESLRLMQFQVPLSSSPPSSSFQVH
jgi:hypothetical protein